MRLISWNVATYVQRQPQQVEALGQRAPDVVALQEVTRTTRERWTAGFQSLGLPYVLKSLDTDWPLPAEFGPPPPKSGVLIASRWPLKALPPLPVPWPACVQSAVVRSPHGPIEVHTVHVPAGESYREGKLQTLHALYEAFAQPSRRSRVLCGDFNSPKTEHPDGTVTFWGPRHQQAAEERILRGLAAFDLADVYRRLYGYGQPAASWIAVNRGRQFPFRLDHVLASARLKPARCAYLTDWIAARLSDHAPVEADFTPRARRPRSAGSTSAPHPG